MVLPEVDQKELARNREFEKQKSINKIVNGVVEWISNCNYTEKEKSFIVMISPKFKYGEYYQTPELSPGEAWNQIIGELRTRGFIVSDMEKKSDNYRYWEQITVKNPFCNDQYKPGSRNGTLFPNGFVAPNLAAERHHRVEAARKDLEAKIDTAYDPRTRKAFVSLPDRSENEAANYWANFYRKRGYTASVSNGRFSLEKPYM